ncbi:hypothetical protein HRR83_000097 [Exophiala dermatitidis]|uniref:Uncharacterized protein n=1 Tax=Exophiala dermatitidis TaxID=5970 RepID=A0AAN6F4E9_EXODE|nr:hypothetical protein HRR73_002631 [Exophiala dermatitidis]KAJ4527346.1 hypothetical protein HRR74_000098 [Exophiala dermatitidis]KAJ4530902.1 hypothetical protein HRR76_008593 [Exophiala dermatitidis]KAJ4558075.1 hypothetical protein HRR77_000098 [Exophiala dermatitidis]KAJ4581896.1 hypothetical protein HRR79_000901 [Exophiala dermatitidis]
MAAKVKEGTCTGYDEIENDMKHEYPYKDNRTSQKCPPYISSSTDTAMLGSLCYFDISLAVVGPLEARLRSHQRDFTPHHSDNIYDVTRGKGRKLLGHTTASYKL